MRTPACVQVEALVLDGDLLVFGGPVVVLVGCVLAWTREPRDLPALHREGGAGIEDGLLAGAHLERTLAEVATSQTRSCPR